MVTVGLHATAGAAGGDHPQTCTPGRITTALTGNESKTENPRGWLAYHDGRNLMESGPHM